MVVAQIWNHFNCSCFFLGGWGFAQVSFVQMWTPYSMRSQKILSKLLTRYHNLQSRGQTCM
jgi:hypothetical protein